MNTPSGCSECTIRDGFNRRIANSGPVPCDVLIVGEAPGADENRVREPFVGPSGKLLNALLQSIGVPRDSVAVTNAVRCQPTNNRAPTKTEVACCRRLLDRTVAEVRPKVIIALGASAAWAVTRRAGSLASLRGRALSSLWRKNWEPVDKPAADNSEEYVPVWVTYHPSYALRGGASVSTVTSNPVCKQMAYDLKRALNGDSAVATYTSVVVDTAAKLKKLRRVLKRAKVIAWDTETSGLDFQNDFLMGLSFSVDGKTGYYLPWRYWLDFNDYAGRRFPHPWWSVSNRQFVRKMLRECLVDTKAVLVGQNTSFDQLFVRQHLGLKVRSTFDTMLAHHLLNENAQHNLDSLTFEYTQLGGYFDIINAWLAEHRSALISAAARRVKHFDLETQSAHETSWKLKGLAPLPIVGPYAAGDAVCVRQLYDVFVPRLAADGLTTLYNSVVMAVQPVLVDSEFYGVQLDADTMRSLAREYTLSARRHKAEFLRAAKIADAGKFNVQSPKQLSTLLYSAKRDGGLGLRAPGGSKSTDKKTLNALINKSPAVAALLAYRTEVKWVQTYLTRKPDKHGRIHPHYNLAGTVTGRLACSNPAVQNIPRESRMRGIYVAAPGRVLMEADFSQAEFRVWGALAKDTALLADARAGMDIHTSVAAAFFGVPEADVTKEQRVQAKNTVFGTMYGRGVRSIAEQFKTTEEKVQGLLELFFSRYPAAKEWSLNVQTACAHTGVVANPFGRKRRLPDATLGNSSGLTNALGSPVPQRDQYALQSRALRQAVNSPIQSTVSDYTLLTIVRCYNKFVKAGIKRPLMVLEVHDSFVWEVDAEDVDKAADIIIKQARRGTNVCPDVPWDVELKVGTRWGELASYAV